MADFRRSRRAGRRWMLNGLWNLRGRRSLAARSKSVARPSRRTCRPGLEGLEGRQLLAAWLGAIPTVTVPAYLGYQVALNGSGAGAPETFTASSSNPNVKVTVAKGHFITL